MAYYGSIDRLITNVGEGKEIPDASIAPVFIDALEAMYSSESTQTVREDAKMVFVETSQKLDFQKDSSESASQILGKSKREFEWAAKQDPRLASFIHVSNTLLQSALKSAVTFEDKTSVVQKMLKAVSIEAGRRSFESFRRHERGLVTDQDFIQEKKALMAIAEGSIELMRLADEYLKLGQIATVRREMVGARAAAATEDVQQVAEIHQELERHSPKVEKPVVLPTEAVRSAPVLAVPREVMPEKTRNRAEAKKYYAEELKQLKDLSVRCYRELERVQRESNIAVKFAFSKAGKQYSELMILSAQMEATSLPEQYMEKEREDFAAELIAFEQKLSEIVG